MSDRKNINKDRKDQSQYLKTHLLKKKKKIFIRFMVPFNIICLFCRRIIKKGIKVNAIKEKILEPIYSGIIYFRFYFKCLFCLKGLSLKTDSKNSSYIAEISCQRMEKF